MLPARVLALVILVALCTAPACAQGGPSSLLARLLSTNAQDRASAAKSVEEQRQATIRDLVSVMEAKDVDKSLDGPFHQAVRLLGTLRATEAIRVLSRNLAYLPPGSGRFVDEIAPRETYYPCAYALTKIGEPSVPAMIDRIIYGTTEQERDLAAWVVMTVEGKDQAVYRLASLAKTPVYGKERIVAAEAFVRDYKPVFLPPGASDLSKPR